MDLMVQKYRFGKERYIKQINDNQEWQKNMMEKGHVRKKSGVTWQEGGGSRHSLAR